MTSSALLSRESLGTGFSGAYSSGASIDSEKIGQMFRNLLVHNLDSATGQARIADPQSDLIRLYQESNFDNWDGEGAKPITPETLREAQRLLEVIPSSVRLPELLAEPSGAIAFEWYLSPSRVYVLSLSGRRRLEYAGLLGNGGETHGHWFYGGELPRLAGEHLRELLTQ